MFDSCAGAVILPHMKTNQAQRAAIREANRLARIIFDYEVKGKHVENIEEVRKQYEAAFNAL